MKTYLISKELVPAKRSANSPEVLEWVGPNILLGEDTGNRADGFEEVSSTAEITGQVSTVRFWVPEGQARLSGEALMAGSESGEVKEKTQTEILRIHGRI